MLEIAVVFHPCSGHAVGTAAEEPGAVGGPWVGI